MRHIVIIGSGPGGVAAALAAARRGARVTLVEKGHTGGTCLNTGCIPTKTFKASADVLDLVHRMGEFAISGSTQASIDMRALVARKNKVIQVLAGGIEKTCAAEGVDLVRGHARIMESGVVQVTPEKGESFFLSCNSIIMAVGSRPLELPNLLTDGRFILSSDDALRLDKVPESILMVGGGVIGCEMACIFRALGSRVTIVEGQDRLLPLPSVDTDLSKVLLREMKKRGIQVELQRTVGAVRVEGERVYSSLQLPPWEPQKAGQATEYKESSVVMVTVGRMPSTEGLGLNITGIECTSRGWIAVNSRLETSVPGIFAIGDALGPEKIMLAHMAAAEAEVAVDNCFGAKRNVDYGVVPSAIFTMPEMASVGLTEAQAKEKGMDILCPQMQVRELGKAHAMGELAGLFKLVLSKSDRKILGVHLCGPHSTDIIAEATLAISMGASADDLLKTIHAHPTLAEGLFEVAGR